jgi:hypothetical protein
MLSSTLTTNKQKTCFYARLVLKVERNIAVNRVQLDSNRLYFEGDGEGRSGLKFPQRGSNSLIFPGTKLLFSMITIDPQGNLAAPCIEG